MQIERSKQMTIMRYDLDKLVSEDHVLRKIDAAISALDLATAYKKLEKPLGRKGHGIVTGLRCLYLQFHYDLSDRETEDRIKHDLAFRWFCGFTLDDQTPDHTFFCRIRTLMGPHRIATCFRKLTQQCKDKKIVRSVFVFVDSSAVISKNTTWAERDKALKDGEEKLNNDNVAKYSADPHARFGCKGKDKFWFGYKRHVAVDMGSMLITTVAATAANVPDAAALKHICPRDQMVFADKGYCTTAAGKTMTANGCHSGAILKNNMNKKNRDKDRWITKVRAPFEGVFSKAEKRARYRGLAKTQYQLFMEAIVYNIKRLIRLDVLPIFAGA